MRQINIRVRTNAITPNGLALRINFTTSTWVSKKNLCGSWQGVVSLGLTILSVSESNGVLEYEAGRRED